MGEETRRETRSRFNLITGEDTYASSTAQNPLTSRRVKSFLVSERGDLEREPPNPKYLNSQLPAKVGWLHQFDHKQTDGSFISHFFAATSTKLFEESGGAWVEVTAVGTLADYPRAVNLNNMMHLSDAVTAWLFDGNNWIPDGFPIPLLAPEIDTTQLGVLDVTSNRYYWTNWADDGSIQAERAHESSSSPRSVGTGALSNKKVVVYQQPGVVTTSVGVKSISRTKASFLAQHVGMKIYVNGTDFGKIEAITQALVAANGILTGTANFADTETVTIDSTVYTFKATLAGANDVKVGADLEESLLNLRVAINKEPGEGSRYGTGTVAHPTVKATANDATTLTVEARTGGVVGNSIASTETAANASWGGATLSGGLDSTADLVTAAPSTQSGVRFVIAPTRASHWNIYASEAEESNVGRILATVPVTTMFYEDDSPFLGTSGSIFGEVERPIRNDPPPASSILEVHKGRIFRTRKTFPNFFNYTAFEEVAQGNNGSPQESVPGADANTISDILNESSFPDESDMIRAMKSHADALYIATEDEIVPLYGDSIDSFALSQLTTFRGIGAAGRSGLLSTPYGLVIFGNSRNIELYPAQAAPGLTVDSTASLVDIGRPKQDAWDAALASDLDNAQLEYFDQSEDDWILVCFQKTDATYETWVYNIETRGWFQLDRGVSSLALFEVNQGQTVLVGGGTDGFVYVLNDPWGIYSLTGLTYPEAIFRPALIDFGKPETQHVFQYIEYEIDDESVPVEVRYWLDPVDVDNPGVGTEIAMRKIPGSGNRFRGFPRGGGLCFRLLIEIKIPAGSTSARLRGVVLKAHPASGLAR